MSKPLIIAEKPDMGTKIAAALFGIPLENGVVVTFSQLEKYEQETALLTYPVSLSDKITD